MQCHADRGLRLHRREFGALAAAGACAAALGEPARARPADAEPLRVRASDFRRAAPVALGSVRRGALPEAVERAVRAAALAATDMGWLSRGDTVLIKPACNSGNRYPATTDPIALRAMIGLLRERGAGRVIVADMAGVQSVRFSKDGLTGSTRALMERSGIARATRDAGGGIHAFEEAGWDGFVADRPAAPGAWRDEIALPAILGEVDHVVLMPRCARHVLAGSTLGLKAAVGWWRHDSRLEYHRDAATFSEKTADANTVPAIAEKLRLTLTSATKVLSAFGPDTGTISEPDDGLVIASTDLVAHDMVSLAWLLENRSQLAPGVRDGVTTDPNTSGLAVNLMNRVVTNWLGGFGEALRADSLERYDLERITDDRVLRRAFRSFGGIPTLELVDADGALPEALGTMLRERTRVAA